MAVVLLQVPQELELGLARSFEGETFRGVAEAWDLIAGLGRTDERISALVVGPEVTDPLTAVQRVHAFARDIPVLILADERDSAALKRAIQFTPFLGEDVRGLSTNDGVEEIVTNLKDALANARQREVDRRAADPGSVPAGRSLRRTRAAQYFGQLLDRAPIGVVTVDRHGLVLGWNRRASQILETPERSAIGASLHDIFGESAELRELLEHALEGEEELPPRVIERDASARSKHIEVTASGIDTHAGETTAMLLLQDVTDRVVAEVERQKVLRDVAFISQASEILTSHLDYAATWRSLGELVVPMLADWCVIHAVQRDGSVAPLAVTHPDAARRKLAMEIQRRYPVGSTDPMGIGKVIRTGEPELYVEISDELLTEAARNEEHLRVLRDLGLRSAIVVPLKAGGRTLGAITLVHDSTSGRRFQRADLNLAVELGRRAALALEKAELFEQARAMESSLRDLVESLDAIVWEADASTFRFTFVSQRAEEMLGYPMERWLSEKDFWLTIMHPDHRDGAAAMRRAAVDEGWDYESEYRVVAADGEIMWIHDKARVIKDAAGRPTLLRGLMSDVTGRKEVEKDLFESKERFQYLARTLQESLLPEDLPAIPGLDVASLFRPAAEGNEVGGDFYDVFESGERQWSVVVGDVCGKGPHAAAVTALARYTVRTASMEKDDPSEILAVLNDAMLRGRSDGRFCTLSYVRIAMDRRAPDGRLELTVTNGGHPCPFIVRSTGEIEPAGTPGMLLGAFPDPDLENATVHLAPGDALVLYTDGVLDAGAPADPLGEEGLKNVLAGCAGIDASTMARTVDEAVVNAQLSGGSRDDCALVVVRVLA